MLFQLASLTLRGDGQTYNIFTMLLSIVILTYNEPIKLVKKCLDTCFQSRGSFDIELILVNNFFSQDQVKKIQALRQVFCRQNLTILLNKKNLGFAQGINRGLKKAQGEYIFLLNPDAWLKKDTLKKLITFARNKKNLGIVAPQMLNPDGTLQPSNFGRFPTLGTELFHKLRLHKIFPWARYILPNFLGRRYFQEIRQVDWVGGGAMLIKKKVIDKIGLFDPNFFLYIEDIDFCCRARKKGFEVWYYPEAKVYHRIGSSFQASGVRCQVSSPSKKWEAQSLQYYFRKHAGRTSRNYYAFTKYHLEPAGLRKLDFIVHSIANCQLQTTNYSILDLGCGQGNISFALASLGCQVLGVDIDKGLIAKLKKKAKSLGLDNLEFKVLDLNRPQAIKDLQQFSPFDLVVASEILEHLKSPQTFLAGVKKILKPQGKVIVTIPNILSPEELMRFFLSKGLFGKKLKNLIKKKFLKKEVLIQTRTNTPHLYFWHYWSFRKLAFQAGFIIDKSFSQSAGFKSFYYILGRAFLRRGKPWFLRLDRWDSFLAQFIPAWAGDGMIFQIQSQSPKSKIKN